MYLEIWLFQDALLQGSCEALAPGRMVVATISFPDVHIWCGIALRICLTSAVPQLLKRILESQE